MAKAHDAILADERATQFNGWLPEELHSWLTEQAVAESRGGKRVSMSAIVRRSLERERKRLENAARKRSDRAA